jgi:hypothetical protein
MSSTSRRTVGSGAARGWCPRHDQLYTARDGLCPDCGTSLVLMDPVPQPEEIEIVASPPVRVPTVRSPRMVRAMVAGLVLAAFIVGLLFPRGEERPRVARAPAGEASQNVRVGSVARTSGGALKLARLTQRGRNFSALVSTADDSLDPRAVVGASVEVATRESDDAESISGVSDVGLTPIPSGFRLDGRLPSDAGRIVQFRISSLQLRVGATPDWDVDISSIWPVRGREPKVLHVGSSRSAGAGRRLTLIAVLAWHDRLEVDLGLPEIASETAADLAIDGLEMTLSGEGDGLQDRWRTTLGAVQQEQISPTEILARFEGIPAAADQVTIRATRVSRFLAGPWSWRIA